jgi:hypothetical protein
MRVPAGVLPVLAGVILVLRDLGIPPAAFCAVDVCFPDFSVDMARPSVINHSLHA